MDPASLELEAGGTQEIASPGDLERALSALHDPRNGFAVLDAGARGFIQARRSGGGFALEHRDSMRRHFTGDRDVAHGEVVTIFRSWLERTSRWRGALGWRPDAPTSGRRRRGSRAVALLPLALGLAFLAAGVHEHRRASAFLAHPGYAPGRVEAVERIVRKKKRDGWRATVRYEVAGRSWTITEVAPRPLAVGQTVTVHYDASDPEAEATLKDPLSRRYGGYTLGSVGAVFLVLAGVFAVAAGDRTSRRRRPRATKTFTIRLW